MSGVNLKNIDLNLLVVFEAIYAAGNISHAANRLAMSQPAVSNALARLRDLIGDPLFVRAKQGVAPTVKAKAIIEPVRQALALIGRQFAASDRIDFTSYRRTLRISTMDVAEPLLIPPLLNMLAERAPGITVESVAARADIVQEVVNNTLDIACFMYPFTSPEISIVPVAPAELVVIARQNHPRIGKRLNATAMNELAYVVLSAELRGFTLVDRELLLHGIKRRVAMGVNRLWSMPAIVTETDLIGIITRPFADYVAQYFPIEIHELPLPISDQHMYMMWNTQQDDDPAHRWLREYLLATARHRMGRLGAAPALNPGSVDTQLGEEPA